MGRAGRRPSVRRFALDEQADGGRVSTMRVFLDDNGEKRLIGTADVPADHGPVLEIRVFDAASLMTETFTVAALTHLDGEDPPATERVVLVSPLQTPSILPRWQPLTS